jgi:hypothetical protein
VAGGVVTHPAVAEGVGADCVPVEQALELEPERQRPEKERSR